MKLSFCTTCMNRLFHLKETYIKNIENAKSCFPNVEFILLDYGSDDGLEDWVRNNLQKYIESGILTFYQTKEPRYWVAAHAKNIAHKMATGDILLNLDCDILIPPKFAEYIISLFEAAKYQNKEIIISFDSEDARGNSGCAGMIGALRNHFYSVNGYDENIHLGWGYDDMNYQFRCRMQNNLFLFTPPSMCLCIPHSNEVRTANCQLKEIQMTRDLSFALCEDAASTKDYIANKNIDWGKANLTKNFNIPLAV